MPVRKKNKKQIDCPDNQKKTKKYNMKHIKTINEYQRTVGFRYSEPREKFNIKVYLDSELTKEELRDKNLKELGI